MLEKNQKAPEFSSADQNNKTITLTSLNDKQNVILYFYPKDDTPGCTIQANQFSALATEFAATDTAIIGVSKDSCESHTAFIKKFDLTFDLLADTSGEICNLYGVWQKKEKNGVKKMGIVRSTFLIDKMGILQDVSYGVSPEGHAAEMLEKVKLLRT